MADTLLLFPGQGAQFVGMGRTLADRYPAARAVFAEADEALGFALSDLCWNGPDERLVQTEFAQPAILTHSLAAWAAVQTVGPVPVRAAVGHSLGEWSALVAAGALSLADAVRLVRMRGRFMQEATPLGVGAMAAILGLDAAVVAQACSEAGQGEVVSVASDNDSSNQVIAGNAAAVQRASALCLERGAMRALPLPVSAPFHCALMAPAAERLAEALAKVTFAPLAFPVRSTAAEAWHGPMQALETGCGQASTPVRQARSPSDSELGLAGNRPAQAVSEAQTWPQAHEISLGSRLRGNGGADFSRALLVAQVTQPVLWRGAIAHLAAAGATVGLALGPAGSVPGMVKRTARGLKVQVVSEADDVTSVAA